MKKLVTLLFISSILFSCSKEEETPPSLAGIYEYRAFIEDNTEFRPSGCPTQVRLEFNNSNRGFQYHYDIINDVCENYAISELSYTYNQTSNSFLIQSTDSFFPGSSIEDNSGFGMFVGNELHIRLATESESTLVFVKK